jgi:hypothetical protein
MTDKEIIAWIANHGSEVGIEDPNFKYGKAESTALRLRLLLSEFPQIAEWEPEDKKSLKALMSNCVFRNDSQAAQWICQKVFDKKRADLATQLESQYMPDGF